MSGQADILTLSQLAILGIIMAERVAIQRLHVRSAIRPYDDAILFSGNVGSVENQPRLWLFRCFPSEYRIISSNSTLVLPAPLHRDFPRCLFDKLLLECKPSPTFAPGDRDLTSTAGLKVIEAQ